MVKRPSRQCSKKVFVVECAHERRWTVVPFFFFLLIFSECERAASSVRRPIPYGFRLKAQASLFNYFVILSSMSSCMGVPSNLRRVNLRPPPCFCMIFTLFLLYDGSDKGATLNRLRTIKCVEKKSRFREHDDAATGNRKFVWKNCYGRWRVYACSKASK